MFSVDEDNKVYDKCSTVLGVVFTEVNTLLYTPALSAQVWHVYNYFSVLFVYGCMCGMPDHTKLYNINHYECKNNPDNLSKHS